MSHIVKVQTQICDPDAITAACARLNLPAPRHGSVQLFSSEATGFVVQLPNWQYPVVIDTASGVVHYDNFQGAWGDQLQLDRFIQAYAVEKARSEARKRGHAVTEQLLKDGSIKLLIAEAA